MKFARNNHPTLLFGPTCLFGTWEYETFQNVKSDTIYFSSLWKQRVDLYYDSIQSYITLSVLFFTHMKKFVILPVFLYQQLPKSK